MPNDNLVDRDLREPYTITLPLRAHVYGYLSIPVPLTPAEWEQMMRVITAMKPGIVEPEEGDARG